MISTGDLRGIPLFGALPDREAETITSHLGDLSLRVGDWIVHEGEQPSFFLVLDGRLEVRKVVHGVDRRINVYERGEYFGELPLLLGSTAVASVRALTAARVAVLEAGDFRAMFASCEVLSSELMQTMTRRFNLLRTLATEAPPAAITIIGHRYDIACHRLRDFLSRNHQAFRWVDPTRPDLIEGAAGAPHAGDVFPVVELPDGTRLVEPTLRQLAESLGLQTRPSEGLYDVVIIGGGPAGLAAAVYGASEGLKTVLVEREAPGGQAGTSSRIENYLGFPNGVSGDDLGTRALLQGRRFGAEVLVARCVDGLEFDGSTGERRVRLDGGDVIRARTIVLATGVAWRQLDLPGTETLVGRGIYYGAARTEALNVQGQTIYLVGGGNSAGQAAMFFSAYAAKVVVVIRADSLARTMSQYLIDQLATKTNIEVRTQTRIIRVNGETRLESIVLENRATGATSTEETSAVFVFIGADAETAWLPRELICDQRGYVCTGRDVLDLVAAHSGLWPLERDPYLLETSVPGVFAAGDVRHGSVKRVASGVGEGSMAIAFVHQYLAALGVGDAAAVAKADVDRAAAPAVAAD